MLKAIFVLPLAMLSACATIVNGTSQTVTVSTEPAGAACTLERAGARVGAIPATPGSVQLDKSGKNLAVTCAKEGYQTATIQQAPSFSGATFGNILIGGVVGVVVDAASGANFSYPSDIRLGLAADPALRPAPMALAPAMGGGAFVQPISASTGMGSAGTYPR